MDFFILKKYLDIAAFSEMYPKSTPFCCLLMYAKGLKFDERPDYEKMRDHMNEVYKNLEGKWNMP